MSANVPDSQNHQLERTVSRAEFSALINRIFSHLEPVRDCMQFKDIPDDHWAFRVIQFVYQTGFLVGYPGQLFRPDAPMLRVQAIAAVASGLRYSAPEQGDILLTQYFDDVSEIPAYAVDAIAAATQNRLVTNSPQVRQLRPNQTITRGELATLLCRALRTYSVKE